MKTWLLLAILLILGGWVAADEIPFDKFMYLDEGMSEGEVLFRVGPPDYEEVVESRFGGKEQRVWYFVPQAKGRWITVIHFDNAGRVVRIERDKL